MRWNEIGKYTSKKIDKSLEIAELNERYIPKASGLKYYPLAVAKAEGSKVWDVDGNEYIDFLTSAAVYNIGHRHPKIVNTILEQVNKVLNYTMAYLYEETPVKLAKCLTEITPGDFEKKVTFGFSGSDSVDSSIKAAKAYTKRRYIISFKNSYHGMTYGALSATGIIDSAVKEAIHPIKDFHFVEFPDPYRNPWNLNGYENPEELSNLALEQVETKIKELNEDVAGIIVEPIQGDAGVIIPPSSFIKGLRKLTEEYGIVFIDEEVQTGMGRTGKWWAIEHFNVVPDVIASAKALGGGMPISAVIGRSEIMESVPAPLFVFTHMGHAVNASAAIATIEIIKEEELAKRAERLEKYVIKRFREMMEEYGIIGDIRGKGLLVGVDIVKNKETKIPDKSTALKISWRAWEKGLILITFGKYGNILRIAPALNIPKEDLDRGLEIIEESIKDVLAGKVPDEIVKFLRGW